MTLSSSHGGERYHPYFRMGKRSERFSRLPKAVQHLTAGIGVRLGLKARPSLACALLRLTALGAQPGLRKRAANDRCPSPQRQWLTTYEKNNLPRLCRVRYNPEQSFTFTLDSKGKPTFKWYKLYAAQQN